MDIYLITGLLVLLAFTIYAAIPFVFFFRTEVIYNDPRFGVEEERIEFQDPQAIIRCEARLANNEFDCEARSKVILYYWLFCESDNKKEIAKEHIVWFIKNAIDYEGHWFAWMTQFYLLDGWEENSKNVEKLLTEALDKTKYDLQALRNAGTFSKQFAPDFSMICWRRLLKEFPDDPEVIKNIGYLLNGKKEYAGALQSYLRLIEIPWSEDDYYRFRKTRENFKKIYPKLILKIPLLIKSLEDWCPAHRNPYILNDLLGLSLTNSNINVATEYLMSLVDCIEADEYPDSTLKSSCSIAARVYIRLGDLNSAQIFLDKFDAYEDGYEFFYEVISLIEDLIKFNHRDIAEKFWKTRIQSHAYSEDLKDRVHKIFRPELK